MRVNIYLPVIAAWLLISCATSANQATKSSPPAPVPKGSNVNPDAGLLADFTARVEAYNELRKDLEKKAPPLKKTDEPAEIALAEKGIAHQIRAARANAQPGEIFTPATRAMFKRLLSPTLKGAEGTENKTAIKDDAPASKDIPFKINGEYPKEAPLSTVPPDVLKALPPLPENLQYRFVGKHLILYCTRGNLIVDYMLNAIP
jgi:hypothetical protein